MKSIFTIVLASMAVVPARAADSELTIADKVMRAVADVSGGSGHHAVGGHSGGISSWSATSARCVVSIEGKQVYIRPADDRSKMIVGIPVEIFKEVDGDSFLTSQYEAPSSDIAWCAGEKRTVRYRLSTQRQLGRWRLDYTEFGQCPSASGGVMNYHTTNSCGEW